MLIKSSGNLNYAIVKGATFGHCSKEFASKRKEYIGKNTVFFFTTKINVDDISYHVYWTTAIGAISLHKVSMS